ncbi:MAG: Ig-like domain-containing protein [Bacteroidales bacterium]|nr:Ig-like domain-containing protein [Bacteroidales bacterium]
MMAIRLNLRFLTLTAVLFSMFFTVGCKDAEVPDGIQGVSVSATTLTMGIGKTRQVYASAFPHMPEGDQIRWSVENPAIATVEDKGTHNGIWQRLLL